ncbi:adenosylmethionine--8-amino-7-oxononanoate transaminase [Pararobbsia silviterrae]|uniref:Adenosylmethionine-8-amino-7-oxononanoate aminotransferase n=1 Tax=Pararobbsia silviterrae TaxID=1792498 RepID=A0A494Y7S8_9BURK|nr:adenosylmethionine--8-amino-7-oxononanoate transaminase [Pararobbsia silviterrae]RKP58742.1 adenosylmethionine--8-amino-7-oxononanoate transaminase [Pararobbsia silviterrae]
MNQRSNPSPGADWVTRSKRAVWHPCTQMKHHETSPMIPIARGQGPWLYDVDGKRYLDAISSWWVNLFGHANPTINAALKTQLDTLEHAMLAGCTHESAIELAERLSALTGHTLGHAFYGSDGASAVEVALKMSFHFWRNSGRASKREFVCLKGSYHGETIGALGVTDVAIFRDAYDPLIQRAHTVAAPDSRDEASVRASVAALAELFAARGDSIAAFIVEPLVQCAAGMVMHPPAFLAAVRKLCDMYNVHLIADEIAVGCGRTGTFFACEQAGIWPDLLCLSKGITGGYLPLSVVLSRDAIFDAFYDDDTARAFLHSHSYTGNPLACRAAIATLDLFESGDVLNTNREKSARLARVLEPLSNHPAARNLRQCGTIFAFDAAITRPESAKTFSRRFFETALRHEMLLRPIGTTVYVMPPYILGDEDIDLLGWRTRAIFEHVMALDL